MPRTFRERPRVAAVAATAALLLALTGALAGAGLASGDRGMPPETAADLQRARAAQRQAVRDLLETQAALRSAREEVRTEHGRAQALERKARGLHRSNARLRRALRRERRR